MALYPVRWSPVDFAYRDPAEDGLRDVARELGLSGLIRDVHVRVSPRARRDLARVAWIENPRLTLKLDCDLGSFLTPSGRQALAHHPRAARLPRRRFSARAARATFLHELSHVKDGVAFGIDSSTLPPRRWAPFNEAWNVWIDGRLWRRGTPALGPGERWQEFCAVFRRRGRPRAWARGVFDHLWRADVLSQRDLLEAVALLVD